MEVLLAALKLLADPYVIFLIIVASLFGLFVGAIPGLTAAMAIALLVPVTFFMAPLPALAMIVTTLRHGDLRRRHSGRAACAFPARPPRPPTRTRPMR